MRDVLGSVLLLAALAGIGYVVWLLVQQRRGRRRDGAPRKRYVALAALLLLLLGSAVLPSDKPSDSTHAHSTDTATASTATQSATTTNEPSPKTLQDANALVDANHFSEALVIAAALGGDAKHRVRRRIADRIGGRVTTAIRRGNRAGARRLLRQSDHYPPTYALASARTQLHRVDQRVRAQRVVAAQRAHARHAAAAKQRRLVRAAAAERRRKAAEAAVAPAPAAAAPSGGSYAGKTCGEIGHSFSVPPGSDPDHDANNDGLACESQ